jgi:hypothetical protein
METQNNRVTLDQHWAASASGDLEAERQIYDDSDRNGWKKVNSQTGC